MIKGSDLENRREPSGTERVHEEQRQMHGRRAEEPEKKGPSLQERIAEAKLLVAKPGACRACFRAGLDAVVGVLVLEGDPRPLAERITEAAGLRPTHDHGGDPAFGQGRDAAVRVIAGEG